jgi:TPR repeat protein
LAKFFNYVELSDLNESLFNFIKGLLLNPWQQSAHDVKQTTPISESDKINSKFSEGVKYFLGKDVPQDYHKSLKYFQFCVTKGHNDAFFYLKALHKKGIDILDNYRHALNYLENPNENIDCDSLTYIGHLHYSGLALPQDYFKSMRLFRAGEAKGSHESTRMIGFCYFFGHGVEQSYETTFKYYHQSYLKCNLHVHLNIAFMY